MLRLLSVVVLCIATGVDWAAAQQEVNQRRHAARNGTVKVSIASGSIRVVGWSRDTVALSGTISRGSAAALRGDDRETRLRIVRSDDGEAPRGDIVVRVPRQSSVAVRTVDGTIHVSGVTGTADLESHTGNIYMTGSVRTVYAESAAGDVELDVSTKVARVKTVDGDITVRGARGYLDVSTVSGSARLEGQEIWETEVTSVSGNITFEGSLAREGTFYAESHSGRVELVLPQNQGADFDIINVKGGIENAVSGEPGGRFSIGGGGTQVRIKNFKGSVAILRGN